MTTRLTKLISLLFVLALAAGCSFSADLPALEECFNNPCSVTGGAELVVETPTPEPTVEPTDQPTEEPTAEPTVEPTEEPTVEPTEEPTTEPTVEPTVEPTEEPTVEPTPEPSAWPDSSTTGPTGELVNVGAPDITQAWLDANNNGSLLLENVEFTGEVDVFVDDLTIRNFKIVGGLYGIDNQTFSGNPTTGLVLEDGEITGQRSAGLLVSNTEARRMHIHHQGSDAVKPFRNVIFEDSYVHHLGSNVGSHSDGVQMVNGSNVIVRGNNFEMPHNEPGYTNSQVIIIQTNNGIVDDVLIENNRINGGGYSVQVNDKGTGYGEPTNDRVINNTFGRDFQFGPIRTGDNTLTARYGNVWEDTGEPL